MAPVSEPAAAPRGSRRERLARAERPLLLAGLALVTAHLLDLAFSGPDTSGFGVAAIVGAAAAWALAQPRITRPTRVALGVVVGLVAVGFGVVSHGLHVVNSGPDWRDVTGVGYIARRAAARRRGPRGRGGAAPARRGGPASPGAPPTRSGGSPARRSGQSP